MTVALREAAGSPAAAGAERVLCVAGFPSRQRKSHSQARRWSLGL